MARLNITVPDELYERLERHRESLNLSRICSAGLQQAVDGLEGQAGRAGPPDAVVTSLVLRLQRTHERWYERGWHDGRAWAAERASPQELRAVATVMAEWTGEQLLAAWEERQTYRGVPAVDLTARPPLFPDSFDLLHALGQWQEEAEPDVATVAGGAGVSHGVPAPGAATAPGAPTPQERLTYLEGWRDGIAELWAVAEPLLRKAVSGSGRRGAWPAAAVAEGPAGRPAPHVAPPAGAESSRTSEQGSLAPLPAGWHTGGNGLQNYAFGVDRTVAHSGRASGHLRSIVDDAAHFGTISQCFKAEAYRGRRLRLTAYVKAEGVEGWAGLWMRIDSPQRQILGFDNMQHRPIRGTEEWQAYSVVLDVPVTSELIWFGLLLHGVGAVWIDDIRFDVVGPEVPVTSQAAEAPAGPRHLDFEEGG